MSFWDTIGGLFNGDTYYPDNPKREARFKQLNGQCQNFLDENKSLGRQMSDLMKTVSDRLRACCPQLGSVPIPLPQDPIYEQIPYKSISGAIAPLFSVPAISGAVLTALVLSEAKDGNVLAATLTATLGVGAMWLTGGLFFGMMPVSLLGMGAIEGAVKRDELRKLIPQAVQSRKKLYKMKAVNSFIYKELQALDAGMRAIGEFLDAEMKSGVIETLAFRHIDKIKQDASVVEAHADAQLAELDRQMNAWTAED